MARKQEKRPLHPLRMAEALEVMNTAASLFAAQVSAVVTVGRSVKRETWSASTFLDELDEACKAFRATMWPEED